MRTILSRYITNRFEINSRPPKLSRGQQNLEA
jgi:hypothetical protein